MIPRLRNLLPNVTVYSVIISVFINIYILNVASFWYF